MNMQRHKRVCFACPNVIENELHFIFECAFYDTLRADLSQVATNKITGYHMLSNDKKLCMLCQNNETIGPLCAFLH